MTQDQSRNPEAIRETTEAELAQVVTGPCEMTEAELAGLAAGISDSQAKAAGVLVLLKQLMNPSSRPLFEGFTE